MINKDLKVINYLSSILIIFCLIFSNISILDAQEVPVDDTGKYLIYKKIEIILTRHLKDEGCWHCHQDMYPDLALNPNNPSQPIISCFSDPNDRPYPLYYSTLDFQPNKKFENFKPSENFTNSETYKQRKKGHLSHLVYQPFGLGRLCLDCHDPVCYTQGDSYTPHPSNKNVYFKDGEKLNQTTICTDCHGGFYPKESEVSPEYPKIDPDSVRLLQWGDPGSVTCLQCHDDSDEHGGMYASYTSHHSSYWREYFYDYEITAPDPDRVSGQNYWSKNGHGLTAQKSFAGATLDTGYTNKGAMNNENIPSGLPDYPYTDLYNKRSRVHDLNLDPNDGRKNFCWECHWSNERVRNTMCKGGNRTGKYNGHLDTITYGAIDERWGPLEYESPDIYDRFDIQEHPPFHICRSCHPTKYFHYYNSHYPGYYLYGNCYNCLICHDPHGSGDENGNANVFMIKPMVRTSCDNCHSSQLSGSYPVINFSDPLIMDICESDCSEDSISTEPTETTDVCEVCHLYAAIERYLPSPGDLDDYKHLNGAGHYFNPNHPNQDLCPNTNSCTIDYRGTDCTGCHVHDPGPPVCQTTDEYLRIIFDTEAFAPTCRCHGIGRIDIATFTADVLDGVGKDLADLVDGITKDDIEPIWKLCWQESLCCQHNDCELCVEDPLQYKVDLKDSLFGKGHGTPPPPFPDGSYGQDPHMAHIRYNFPCLTCHIDPFGKPYEDTNEDYIFSLNNYTPIGFNPFINPNGIYDDYYMTCSNLYCHSNGRGTYADPIEWSDSERFCRDPNNSYCLDEDGHFLYCDNCHRTPPDSIGYHSNLDKGCEVCHPHNGSYENSRGEFYKHVNRQVDIKEVYCDNNTPEEVDRRCLECHYDILDAPCPDFECDSDKIWRHIANSNCLDCHEAVCDPDTIEHYKYEDVLPLFSVEKSWNEDTGCGACHHEDHLTNDYDKTSFKNLKDSHDKITSPCKKCHGEHRALNIDTTQCTKCISCHMDSHKRSAP